MRLCFDCCCREPEIDDFDLSIATQDNVVSFDVTVRNTHRMQIANCLNDLNPNVLLLLLRQHITFQSNIVLKSLSFRNKLEQQMNLSRRETTCRLSSKQ